MIDLFGVSDAPRVFGEQVTLLTDADFHLPPGRYALMSETPEWHRPLIDVLAGLRLPARGRVVHGGVVSWPLGRQGFVRGRGTGLDIINLVASIHELDVEMAADVVTMLVSRPELIDLPVEHWPQFARIEFTFALGLVPDFDIYVIDGSIPSEPSRFTRLWQALFEERLVGKTLILASYRQKQLLDYCAKALVYDEGRFAVNDDLEACIERFPLRPSREDSTSSGATPGDDGGDLGF
jgi:capsular polysaccharide transport system ATP-binding protein